MADNELRLVSKIIRERDLKPALERGIATDWFVNPIAREVWTLSLEHWHKYGVVPTLPTVQDQMPGVTLLRVEESFEYLIDQFVAWRRRNLTIALLRQAGAAIDTEEDHEKALQILGSELARIQDAGISASRDVNLSQTVDDRIDGYLALRELPDGLRGVPTGFPTIDRATLGLQPGQLITVVAVPKVGKSTLSLRIATNIHMAGKVPLFVTFEMSNDEQAARHDSMRTGISHTKLLSGRIDNRDEAVLRAKLESTKDLHGFHLVADPTSTATVSGLAAKVETYRPDVLIVDGVYLMTDEASGEQNTPQALTGITRNLKRLAQRYGIPVVQSTQALTWKVNKRRGITSDSIGYCVDEATEILTERGWRQQGDISVGDVVLTLNHDTGLSEWQPLLAVNRFPEMSRDLVLMEGKAHSSLSTAQHRWPLLHHNLRRKTLARTWGTTGSLNSCDYLITAAESAHLPEEPKFSDALVELVAWFWTEGHVSGDYGNVGLTQSFRVNPGNVSRIRGALYDEFGPEWIGPIPRIGRMSDGIPRWRESQRPTRGLSEFWLSVAAGKELLALAPNKVPSFDFLLSLTRAQLLTFIEVSMLADRNGERSLAQSSRQRSESFQFACVLAGINASLTSAPPTASCPSTMWQVTMRKRQVVTPIAAARQGARFAITSVRHDGMIWCPTTRNSTWMARRKGNVYFTGNSSSFFQDSDVLLGLQFEEDDDDGDNDTRLLRVMNSRNCGRVEAVLDWDWTTGNFSEIGTNAHAPSH